LRLENGDQSQHDCTQTLRPLALIVAVCAACGASFKDSAAQTRAVPLGKAHVYVYREASIYGSGDSYDLYANSHLIARMTNGGYFDFDVDPGQVALGVHEVVIPLAILTHLLNNLSLDSHPLYTVRAQAGQTYYVKFELGIPDFKMTPVSKDGAVAAMSGMNRFDRR
jgi:Protein of unknown function (DUF2846)